MNRLEIASKILAGFAANSAVFASRSDCGWSLCNCTDEDLVGYALVLADKLIEGEKVTADRQANIQRSETGEARSL
jgi:hypothetical protein